MGGKNTNFWRGSKYSFKLQWRQGRVHPQYHIHKKVNISLFFLLELPSRNKIALADYNKNWKEVQDYSRTVQCRTTWLTGRLTHPPLSRIHFPSLLATYFPTNNEIFFGKSFFSVSLAASLEANAYTATILPQLICPSSNISSATFTKVWKGLLLSRFNLLTIPLKAMSWRLESSFTVLLIVLLNLLGAFFLSSLPKVKITSSAITSASRLTRSRGEPIPTVCVPSSITCEMSFKPFAPGRRPNRWLTFAKRFLLLIILSEDNNVSAIEGGRSCVAMVKIFRSHSFFVPIIFTRKKWGRWHSLFPNKKDGDTVYHNITGYEVFWLVEYDDIS